MKILILSNNDIGIYKFRKELLKQLIQEGHKIFISLPKGKAVNKLKEIGCEFIDTDINRRGINIIEEILLLLKYKKMIKDIKPDVVLTYTIKPNIYGGIMCRINKIPYITNITGLGTGIENNNLLTKVILKMYRLALKKSNCVFCQNQYIYDFLIDNKIAKNLKIIPGSGVNIKEFKVQNYPDNEEQIFLFIGRIMKEKGIEEYLEAAKKIKNKYPNTTFKILGIYEDEYADSINRCNKEGIVKYCGFVSNIKKYIKNSNCTILPSYHEGMSNALLESAAMGRPIIASNIPGCKEVVEEGKNGYLFEVKNTDKLIEKIEIFLELSYEQKKQMGLEGRKIIEKQFDRRIILNAYLEQIKKIGEKQNEK